MFPTWACPYCFQIWPIWVFTCFPYRFAQVVPIGLPYVHLHMFPTWVFPGCSHMIPIWAFPYVSHMGLPILFPDLTHMGIYICFPCGFAHVVPISFPCGHLHMFPTWVCPDCSQIWPILCQYGAHMVRLGGFCVGTPVCIPSGLFYQKPHQNQHTWAPNNANVGPIIYVLHLVGSVWARPFSSHLGFPTNKNPPKPTHMGPI